MTDKTGGPAFPLATEYGHRIDSSSGMFLRDYFAAKALQGLLAGVLADGSKLGENTANLISSFAYELADTMLKEREK